MSELAQFFHARWPEMMTFVLVLGRASGLVIGAPFWGGRVMPSLVRLVVAVSLSVALYHPAKAFLSKTDDVPFFRTGEPTVFSLLMALGVEILLGLGLGWAAQFLLVGARLAGQVVEIRMGLGLSQLIDPHEGGQTTALSMLFELIAALVFFSIDGHLFLIQALASSYSLFPLGTVPMQPVAFVQDLMLAGGTATDFARMPILDLIDGVVGAAGAIFTIALRMSAPVVVGLLLSDIILGVISRAIPQMNIFLVSLPLQLALGILLLLLSLPVLVWFCMYQFSAVGGWLPAFGGVPESAKCVGAAC
jgi:flagellar biosynthetic protein FliR